MTITPDQAQTLLDGATPGPWGRTQMGALTDTDGKVLVHGPDGNMDDGDANLAAAAPDLAQTIAGMRWEYALETLWGTGHDWAVTTGWFPTPERAWADLALDTGPTRIVRRLVSETEVIDGE